MPSVDSRSSTHKAKSGLEGGFVKAIQTIENSKDSRPVNFTSITRFLNLLETPSLVQSVQQALLSIRANLSDISLRIHKVFIVKCLILTHIRVN